MELIKLSENKTRLVLNRNELETYGIGSDRNKNVRAVEKIFLYLKKSSGIDLAASSSSVKVKLCQTGECEITVEKTNLQIEIKTFVFNPRELDVFFEALKNADWKKNCALYQYKDVYILELLASKNSPLFSRFSDFGHEVVLSSRRDFLSSVCNRVKLP